MSSTTTRLARLEAVIPPIREPDPYDISRLTAAQMERCARLRERVDAVGMEGLTDAEVEEGAAVTEILLAPQWPVPTTEQPRGRRTT